MVIENRNRLVVRFLAACFLFYLQPVEALAAVGRPRREFQIGAVAGFWLAYVAPLARQGWS